VPDEVLKTAEPKQPVTKQSVAPSATPEPLPDKPLGSASATVRMRSRLARLGRTGTANPALEPLFRIVRSTHPKSDLSVLEHAYRVAEEHHRGQMRLSGDPFITHPLAVTSILAEMGMTVPTLAAALLHDTVEDTSYTLEELRADFGDEVALLVDGVTKLDKVRYGETAEAETIRKMIVAMSRDVRVLVMKLADRLHNMRTLRYVRPAKQEIKAKETLQIYAPLAHRLGMNTIKWELEDLSFATLHPKVYDEIVRMVAERAPARDEFLAKVIDRVQEDLRGAKIKATVTGRPKHYYSIYQKMIVRGREFNDIYDLVGVRVLTESVRDCYAALGVLHARWNPVPGRFKDFVAMPKFNMYQSLHTTVIGPEGKSVELQIRTYGMHRRADYGVAAHWKYKEDIRAGEDTTRSLASAETRSSNTDMTWVRELMDWQRETEDPGEFLDSLRFEISSTEVYVFTPRGEVIALPAGATPVDFAYAIHTEVGHHCIGARVNGRLVPLESQLDNGDVIEIFTSKAPNAGPSRDWLAFVKSPRARSKIRQFFTKERREEAIERGKDLIAKQLRREGLPLQRMLTHETMSVVATELRHPDVSTLYAAVGEGGTTVQSVVRRITELFGGQAAADDEAAETVAITGERERRKAWSRGDAGVVVKGASDVWAKLARCCTPVPGDSIVGFVTRASGVSVHRADCSNVSNLSSQPGRMVDVEWAPTAQSMFLVAIQVEALDRARLLADVTRVLSDMHLSILAASVVTTRDRIAKSRFTFEMADPAHLAQVLKAVKSIQGVFDARRVTQ
jgi:GTP diphosphokinase / guanosine-3',5'-bis(diphosphate) 3'-diphosphatase